MSKTNPKHYRSRSGLEAWEIMIEKHGLEAFIGFCECNVTKYRLRAGKKEGESFQDDMHKAEWYENKIKELKQTNK